MKTLLLGVAFAAVGVGITVWAVKRAIDFNDTRGKPQPKPEPGMRVYAYLPGAPSDSSWPLFNTGGRSN